MNLKAVLLEQMVACHDQKNWFVPLKIALDGVSAEQAAWKSGDSNSIWQIVNHLIYWNERYLNRFKGNPLPPEVNNDATFDITDPNGTDEEWEAVVSRLFKVMSDWVDAVKEYDEEKLVISYLTKIKQELHTLSNGEEKDDLLSAFELLSQELSKDQPRTFLISSLLDYLGKHSVLSQNVSQLKSIIL